jgi:hypothetical protein
MRTETVSTFTELVTKAIQKKEKFWLFNIRDTLVTDTITIPKKTDTVTFSEKC